jgi:hypothetical protein
MAIESRATQIAAIGYTFLILSSIATCLRVYCRAFVIKAFALDDWFAVIAQVCIIEFLTVAPLLTATKFMFIVFCSYELTGTRYGTGRHFKDISEDNLVKAMQVRHFDTGWFCDVLIQYISI